MRRRNSRRRELNNALLATFKDICEDLDVTLKQVISQPRNWAGFEDSTTYRANGSVVQGSFRNIEDLGNLLGSQQKEVGNFKATFSWDGNGVTPVQSVFFGFRTKNSFVAGRDWITPAIEEVNLPESFRYRFNTRFR